MDSKSTPTAPKRAQGPPVRHVGETPPNPEVLRPRPHTHHQPPGGRAKDGKARNRKARE